MYMYITQKKRRQQQTMSSVQQVRTITVPSESTLQQRAAHKPKVIFRQSRDAELTTTVEKILLVGLSRRSTRKRRYDEYVGVYAQN